jgi:hypothetical protein
MLAMLSHSARGRVILLVVALFSVGLALDARAQSIGAKGGLSLSSIDFNDSFAEDTGMEAGLAGGGFARFRLPLRLAFQVEGLFVEERATVEGIQKDRFRYLEVPLLVRYRVLGSEDGRPIHVSGGVVMRRLLDAEETIFDETFSITDGVRKNDLALAVGADIELVPRLHVDVRYQMSREGTYRRGNGSYAGKQRALRLMVGYTFRQ